MRLLTLAAAAVLLLGTALAYFTYFRLNEAHIAALVPGDFRFGVFYSSTNDLVELYEGPYRRKDFQPALVRIGRRINVPGLDGVDYRRPVGYYVSRDGQEMFLVPYEDYGVLSDAFDTARENLNLKDPVRVASNYLSLSAATDKAGRGKDHPLVVAASRYPVALAGQPEQANDVRLMLTYLLAFDGVRPTPGVPLASQAAGKLPDRVAGLIAEDCKDLLVGFRKPADTRLSGIAEIEVTPAPDGILQRAAKLGAQPSLAALLKCFPRDTMVLAGAALDKAGWERIGCALDFGDGALAFGVIMRKYHSRRFTLLVAAKPATGDALSKLAASGPGRMLDDAATPLDYAVVADLETKVHTAQLEGPPQWLGPLLRTNARKDPPPVYLSTAVENGVWLCAVGSQAENAVRTALACMRGAVELSIFGLGVRGPDGKELSRASPARDLAGNHIAVAMATAEGMRAFAYPMPHIDIAGIGRPNAVTFTLDTKAKARATLRFVR